MPTDTTPPQITDISGISDGDTITTAVVFTATASDDTGIASFRLTVGGTQVVDAAREEITYSWDVRQIQPGPYDLVFAVSDAAGNTDSETLTVTVFNNDTPMELEPPPEQEPEPQVELDTQPVIDFDYHLPPMDPALYNAQDRGIPSILFVGIKNNDVLYETRSISATATDDTGVNVITMLVDGHQLVLEEGYSLYYEWDTTAYEDGPHTVTFVVRDNGASVGQCSLEVTIDNTTDHSGPVIDPITDSSWTYEEFSGPLAHVQEVHYGLSCSVMGVAHLRVKATDPQGVAELRMETKGREPFSVAGGYLEYDLSTDTESWYGGSTVMLTAVDSLGNSSFCQLGIGYRNNCRISGYVRAANGLDIGDAEMFVLPGHCDSLADVDTSTAVATDETYGSGRFEFKPVPSGLYTLYARRGSYEELVPLELLLKAHEYLIGEDSVVLGARHGYPVSNTRLAIVTGSGDDVPAAIETMLTTEFHYYANPEPGRRQLPEAVDLIDGDNSLAGGEPDFMEFVSDPALLSRYRYMIIESGNAWEAQWLADPATVAALRGWVEDGGQLVLTGQSYDFAEQMYPQTHDFLGSDELDGWLEVPEAHNAAQAGQQELVIHLGEKLKASSNHTWNLPKLLDQRGVATYPPLTLPDGWPLIVASNYTTPGLRTCLRSAEPLPGMVDTVPLITRYQTELGRVVLVCFPITQPDPDSGWLTALILDLLTFDGE